VTHRERARKLLAGVELGERTSSNPDIISQLYATKGFTYLAVRIFRLWTLMVASAIPVLVDHHVTTAKGQRSVYVPCANM
jgi:hypothetical protein